MSRRTLAIPTPLALALALLTSCEGRAASPPAQPDDGRAVVIDARGEAVPPEEQQATIEGGTEVLRTTDFPGVVALMDSAGRHRCGGTLIARRWVLTAAHCPQITTVLFNCLDLANPSFCERRSTGTVREHPRATGRPELSDDIALLPLTSDAPASAVTYPLISDVTEDQQITSVTLLGWGLNQHRNLKLHKLTTSRVSAQDCALDFQGTRVTFDAQKNLCSKSTPERHACDGDSGGSALAFSRGATKLAGVISFACDDMRADRHMRVVAYRSWIECVMTKSDSEWRTQCPV